MDAITFEKFRARPEKRRRYHEALESDACMAYPMALQKKAKPAMTLTDEALFEKAEAVRRDAYAPYSHYKVGVAIVDEAGQLHVGCNVENAAYPLSVCAEISAISAMVAEGGKAIKKMAVVGGAEKLEFCAPCGGCRQAISEFAQEDTEVLLKDENGAISRYSVPELLPLAFRLEHEN